MGGSSIWTIYVMFNKIARVILSLVLFLAPLSLRADDESMYSLQQTKSSADKNGDEEAVWRGANVKYYYFELARPSPSHAAIRSAFVPGWGQAFNRQSVKGALFFLTFVGTAAGSLSQYRNSRESFDLYKKRGVKESPSYDDYKSQQTRATVLGGVALLAYGLSIVDAYRNAYNPIYSRQTSWDVAWQDEAVEVQWSRKF